MRGETYISRNVLASTQLLLYRFKYIKLLQGQSLTVSEIFIPSKNLEEISKIYSFQNVFHGYRQFHVKSSLTNSCKQL